MPSRTFADATSGDRAPDRVEGLVSVIIPVHNRPKLLVEAVQSVLEQTYRKFEIVIVDDGSTDETPIVAAGLAQANPDVIQVISRSNGGPGLARETGRQAAKGEFVQYLDSDDLILPAKFDLQVEALREAPAASAAYGISQEIEPDGAISKRPERPSNEAIGLMFPRFLRMRWWQTASPLYRSDALDQIGPWTDLWLEEDWEYDCRVAALGKPVQFVPAVVCQHRHLGIQRLSGGSELDPRRLRFRARAHELIYHHAQRAGGFRGTEDLAHFSRELFLLSRQCGAAGLTDQSKQLFALARAASNGERAFGLDFTCYRALAACVGWKAAGRAAALVDKVRPFNGRRRSQFSVPTD
jgi:GT2 family glycosyltransferase